MKLIPKAKPVKIRIKSGGEEHSSLDSLKSNFNIRDVQSLLDGRLGRWLRQQGEKDLAEVVSKVDSTSLNTLQGIMNVMQIFFKDYMEANDTNDLLALTKHWLNSTYYRKNGENLFSYIAWELFDNPESLEITKYLYKHRGELKIPSCDWYMIFHLRIDSKDEDKTDPEVLYTVGKMLWEGYQFNDLYVKEPYKHYKGDPDGLEMIEKSARLGCQEANLFIFEYNRKQKETLENNPKDTGRFAGVNREKIKRWIDNKWETDSILKFFAEDYANDKERSILNFICQCRALVSYCARLSWETTLEKASYYFFPDKKKGYSNDMLAKEKWFIIGLLRKLNGYPGVAKDAFTKAGDYPPAQYMLSSRKLLNDSDLKSMTFPSQVSYVVRYLFDYE